MLSDGALFERKLGQFRVVIVIFAVSFTNYETHVHLQLTRSPIGMSYFVNEDVEQRM